MYNWSTLLYTQNQHTIVNQLSSPNFFLKRNEVLILPTTCMNFENAMFSERSQTQKATYRIIPFIWNIQDR